MYTLNFVYKNIASITTYNIYVKVDQPNNNRDSDYGLIIESKNHRNLSDNEGQFRTYLESSFGEINWSGWFTDEEWSFILSLNLPYNYGSSLQKVYFMCYH